MADLTGSDASRYALILLNNEFHHANLRGRLGALINELASFETACWKAQNFPKVSGRDGFGTSPEL